MPKGKPINKDNSRDAIALYRRILRIDEMISRGNYPSTKELMKDETGNHDEFSRATLFRTIELMKNQLHAPIEFDKAKNGYYYSEKTFRLPAVWTSEQELIALSAVKNMIEFVQGTPMYENAKALLELVESSTVINPNLDVMNEKDHSESAKTGWLKDRLVCNDNRHIQIDDQVWKLCLDAMRNNKEITFTYTSYKGVKDRVVRPFQIINSRNQWYLWCWEIAAEDFRFFTLNKITNVKITSKTFFLPKEWDFREICPGEFNAFYNKESYHFKIWFNHCVANYIYGHTWGKNQKIEQDKERLILEFDGCQYPEVLEFVLSYGANAHPLEPAGLVKDWKNNILKMADIAEKI